MKIIDSLYIGGLRTKSSHLKSQNTVVTDAPVDNNGKGEAFSPTDLVCASLSACMMTLMGIVARRENIDLTDLSTEVSKVMNSNPRKISEIHVSFHWKTPTSDLKLRQKLKNAALTCPVALSLDKDIKQKVDFDF